MHLDRRLLRHVWEARQYLAATIGLGALSSLILVFQARLLSPAIGHIFLAGQSLRDVRHLVIGFLALAAGRALAGWGAETMASRVATRVKTDLQGRLVEHLLRLGPTYCAGERTGELSNTVTEGIEALDAYLRQYLPQVALAAIVPIGMLALVFPVDALSAVILLVTAPLIPFFMALIGSQAEALTRKQWKTLSRLSAHFLDTLQGLTTLKLLGRAAERGEEIAETSDRHRLATMGVLRVAFLSALVLEMVATISTAVVAVQIGLRLLAGRLGFEDAFFVLLLAPEFYLPLRLLGTRFHAGMAGAAAAQRVLEVLETSPPVPSGVATVGRDLDVVDCSIRFNSVCYTYPGRTLHAVDGLDITLEPGEILALVGSSGSGKSTVAHLLLRFVEPQEGAIWVGSRQLCAVPSPIWRRQIAWVPQTPYLFNDSVLENIWLGMPEATLAEVRRAAELAQVDTFVEALPDGYETLVGERGARLSAGEGQRIALARAFLRQAPILILDEATANLDPEQAQGIQASAVRLMQGRTTLVIAHRLSTVRRADRILVMEKGRIVEEGRHAELMASDGVYRSLLDSQSRRDGVAA